MKKQYAITSSGKTLRSFHDLRFGNCNFLVIHTPGADVSKLIVNPFAGKDDADMQLAEFLRANSITSIITGSINTKVSSYLVEQKMQHIMMDEDKIKMEEILSRIG